MKFILKWYTNWGQAGRSECETWEQVCAKFDRNRSSYKNWRQYSTDGGITWTDF